MCAHAHMCRTSKPICGLWTTTVCVSFFTCVCVKYVYVSFCVGVGVSVHIFVHLIEAETLLAEVVYQGHYLAHIQLIHKLCV